MAEKKRQSVLRKVAEAAGSNNGCSLVVPAELSTEYPAIAEYMSSVAWPDGSEREVSTLTFLLEDGKLKGCINDRANQRGLWRSGDTFAEVLACLECAVSDDRSTWRSWSKNFKGGAARK